MGLFGAGDPPCPAGSICSGQSKTPVGRTYRTVKKPKPGGGTETVTQAVNTGTDIYHASASKVNTDGTVTTDVYIIKNGQWKKAATTTDGGKSYTYDDDVAGAGLKKELNNPDGAIHKNVDANINKAADSAGVTKDIKDNMVDGNGNTANDADEPAKDGEGDADTPTAPKKPGSDVQQRTEYEQVLRYPIDINTETQDFLKIMMVEYEPRGLTPGGGGLGIAPRGNLELTLSDDTAGGREILSNIYLPIPNGIADSNGVDWGTDEINAAEAIGTDLLGKLIQGGDVAGSATAAKEGVQGNAEGVKDAAAAAITQSITGVNKLARESGVVLNNNLELLFKGPSLRDFSFNFNLSARSTDEGNSIMKIIRTLKQGMSAKKSDGFLFIKSPHTFFLGYYKGDKIHPYLNRFKECALTNLSINYAPAQYSTYVDGVITNYQVTMSFKELEPVFDDDYGNDYENIGF